jgi:hypothetical protein
MRGRMTLTAVILLAALLGGLFVQNLTRVYADPPSADTHWEYATFDIVYLSDSPDWVVRFPNQKMYSERTVDNLFQDLGPGLPDKAAATYLDVINRLGEQGWELASFDQRASQAANAYDQRWMFKRIKR